MIGQTTKSIFILIITLALLPYSARGYQGNDCTIRWSLEIDGVITKGGLAIGSDDTIYAGTSAGWIYALYPDSSVKWAVELVPDTPLVDGSLQLEGLENIEGVIPDSIIVPDGEIDSDDFSHASPTLSDDGHLLYVSGRVSGNVYALNTQDGSIEWIFRAREIPEVRDDPIHYGGGFVSSPAIGADGTLYMGSGDWWGDQWWDAREMGIDIDAIQNRRFSDRRLYAINPDGTLKWIFTVEATDTYRTAIFASPAIGSDGTLYFGSFNGIFYAIQDEGDKAKELWRYEVINEHAEPDDPKYQEFWSSAAIDTDGIVYVGNNDRSLYAFYPNGTIKWIYETGNEVYQSPTIGGNGTIYIGSEDQNFYALNPDGTLRWIREANIEDELPFTAAVAKDGTIVYGMAHSNRIIALNGNTGEQKWQCILGEERYEIGTSTDPAIGSDGTIYMFGGGSIHAIEGSSPLSSRSPWPKVQRDSRNSGNSDS